MSLVGELYDFIKNYHKEETLPNHTVNHTQLNPTLRPYQLDAVKWMLNREKLKHNETTECQGYTITYPSGGILADEMGLGKTVEVLACIISNPFQDEVPASANLEKLSFGKRKSKAIVVSKTKKMKRKTDDNNLTPRLHKTGIQSEKYDALRAWYEESLCKSKPKTTYVNENTGLQCYCSIPPDCETVVCESCGSEQHTLCVGLEEDDYNVYYCPKCLSKQEPIKSRATFIVSPSSICLQWVSEIKNHIKDPNFKVLVYEGVRGKRYIQPAVLADNDVVITTYQVLRNELNYSQEEEFQRTLRHSKRYHSVVTPLTCVSWWRLCLDEAQMVEGCTTKTALMVKHIIAQHRWTVTGTPIQKSLSDLFGLIQFLRVEPFCNLKEWNYLLTNAKDFHSFMAPLMWRNSKSDVLQMLGIPPQTQTVHRLHFSPVEAYFYRIMHSECSQAFAYKMGRFCDINVPIKSLDQHQLSSVLLPMLKLRQACTHPQVIRGKYVKFKHTMTMDELMKEMITKTKVDVDTSLRQLVSALNGVAAIDQIEMDPGNAVTHYRRVIALSEEYASITKVDSLQMIHTLYNLAEVLEIHGADTHETLRQQALALEDTYLKKSDQQLISTLKTVTNVSETVDTLSEGKPLGFTSWWTKVINWAESDDLLNRICCHLEDNRIPGHICLSDKLTNTPKVLRELGVWLANADTARTESLHSLKSLNEIPKDFLTRNAVNCHLLAKTGQRKRSICALCETDKVLKKYESFIFSISKQNPIKEDDIEKELKEEVADNKNVAELKEVTIFTTKKEGSWKPSQHERILHALASYAKLKRAPTEWIEDSIKHLALLECVRKEFKWLRAEWRHLSHAIDARDELSMAKLKLRLPTEAEMSNTTSKKKKRNDIFVIQPHEVPQHAFDLQTEISLSESTLKKNFGLLLYLQNIQKNGTTENDHCPVCRENLSEKWSVLQCGHCFCFKCIPTLLNMSIQKKQVECPLCRFKSTKNEISYVVARKDRNQFEGDLKLEGSFSTKARAVVLELKRLLVEDSDVKVLIFSTWVKVLDVISEALQVNNVSFRRVGGIAKFNNALTQFKNGPVTALLLPLNHGSKGLNIVEATHVFLVEPILNPADEQQAIGRVHRIGQTKPTYVHRFVIINTIEEQMLTTMYSSTTRSEGDLSLIELYNLFHVATEENQEEPVLSIDE